MKSLIYDDHRGVSAPWSVNLSLVRHTGLSDNPLRICSRLDVTQNCCSSVEYIVELSWPLSRAGIEAKSVQICGNVG